MAKSIAEYLMNRYFFGKGVDPKWMAQIKGLFLFDMQYNLNSGYCSKLTHRFMSKRFQDAIIKIYTVDDGRLPINNDVERMKVQTLFSTARFIDKIKTFTDEEKLNLLQQFELKHYKPGQRMYHNTKIDAFYLIIRGSIGVFHSDYDKIESARNRNQLVCINEAEAVHRMNNKQPKKSHTIEQVQKK